MDIKNVIVIVSNQAILTASKYTGRLGLHNIEDTKISDTQIDSSCHGDDCDYKQFLRISAKFWDEFLKIFGSPANFKGS